jgi:hypothetical protein
MVTKHIYNEGKQIAVFREQATFGDRRREDRKLAETAE